MGEAHRAPIPMENPVGGAWHKVGTSFGTRLAQVMVGFADNLPIVITESTPIPHDCGAHVGVDQWIL